MWVSDEVKYIEEPSLVITDGMYRITEHLGNSKHKIHAYTYDKSDAVLIETAPEMLDALEVVISDVDTILSTSTWNDVIKAIDKARGIIT